MKVFYMFSDILFDNSKVNSRFFLRLETKDRASCFCEILVPPENPLVNFSTSPMFCF